MDRSTPLKAVISIGEAVVVFLLLLPVALKLPELDLSTTRAWANVFGILAISSFLVAAMLSHRIPRLDAAFGGLIRVWKMHRFLGAISLVSVFLHIGFLFAGLLQRSLEFALSRFFPSFEVWQIWTGWASLALMLIFLLPSFKVFGEPNYQRWKRLHLISIPALILALAHVFYFTNDRLLWGAYSVIAGTSVVWRKFISVYLARLPYEVVKVDKLVDRVVEFTLDPVKDHINFQPGQFVYLTPYDPNLENGVGEEHPYTISSAPGENTLRMGIKALGDATKAIQNIGIGTRVTIEGPYGAFLDRYYPNRAQLWIAGGIGVTPFIGAARSFLNNPDSLKQPVHLLYLVDSLDRASYRQELEEIASKVGSFSFGIHLFKEEGVVTRDYISGFCHDFSDREIYLCGPIPMLDHVNKILRDHGIPRIRIHTEKFNLL